MESDFLQHRLLLRPVFGMKRRRLLEGIGAASIVTVVPAGVAAGSHDDCIPETDSRCRFLESKCSEIDCPFECCDCICKE